MCPIRDRESSARQVTKVNGHRPTDARRGQAEVHLSALQVALQATGLLTRYDPLSSGPPQLVVTNPQVARLSEVIFAAPVQAGTPQEEWWFWWPWAERICRVGQLQEAARRIAQVLATRDGD